MDRSLTEKQQNNLLLTDIKLTPARKAGVFVRISIMLAKNFSDLVGNPSREIALKIAKPGFRQ